MSFYKSIFWKRLRSACLARDRLCVTPGCGARAVVADHIRPRSKGGADTLENLRGLCIRCHNQRRQGGEPRVTGCDASGRPHDPTHWWNAAPQANLSGLRGGDRLGGPSSVCSGSGKN